MSDLTLAEQAARDRSGGPIPADANEPRLVQYRNRRIGSGKHLRRCIGRSNRIAAQWAVAVDEGDMILANALRENFRAAQRDTAHARETWGNFRDWHKAEAERTRARMMEAAE